MQGVLMMLKNNEKSTGARHGDAQEEQATHHDVYAPRWRRTALHEKKKKNATHVAIRHYCKTNC